MKNMTDKKFQILLDELAISNARYKGLLNSAEHEIERRYKRHPSDIDNDYWIDTFHVGIGQMTIKELDDSMKRHIKTHRT